MCKFCISSCFLLCLNCWHLMKSSRGSVGIVLMLMPFNLWLASTSPLPHCQWSSNRCGNVSVNLLSDNFVHRHMDLKPPPSNQCKSLSAQCKDLVHASICSYLMLDVRIKLSLFKNYFRVCDTNCNTLTVYKRRNDKTNDFALEILAGAIPRVSLLTLVWLGVAYSNILKVADQCLLCSGSVLVTRNIFGFNVTIPHCLNLESHNDVESLHLAFLKGDHEMNSHQMQQAGDTFFNPHKRYGALNSATFAFPVKYLGEPFRRQCCVYTAIPHTKSPRDPASVYCFVTFLLSLP